MMKIRFVVAVVVAVLPLCACGPAMLDTSSVPAFVESTQEIRASLEPEQLPLFEDAFDYLTDHAEITSDPKYLEPVIQACAHLNGMTAEQIMLEAWQTRVDIVKDRIAEFEAQRDSSAPSRKVLRGFKIIEARLFPMESGFLERAVVEVEAENRTRQYIYTVSLEASLRHQDELEPWVVETVNRPFGNGLKPGRRTTFRLELVAKEWRRITEAGSKGVFACDVVRIEGRRNKLIAASDYSGIDEYLLDALGTRLEELRTTKPPERH